MGGGTEMLAVRNVFAGYNGTDVLFDVSFSIDRGQNLSIIGPNGCGKTTLLRTVSNLIAFKGEVLLEGRSVKKIKRKELARKIALLSQMAQVYFTFSVWDTVMMGRYAHSEGFLSGAGHEDKQITEECLRAVHMLDLKNRDIDSLSGGQIQRVYLARILVQQPDVILLDEPTNHLDLAYQAELTEFLKEWQRGGERSVVGVFHDIAHAAGLSDDMLLMDNGKIAAIGKSEDIIRSDILNEVYGINVREYMRKNASIWQL